MLHPADMSVGGPCWNDQSVEQMDIIPRSRLDCNVVDLDYGVADKYYGSYEMPEEQLTCPIITKNH